MSKAEEATNDFCTRCFKYNKCTKVQSECVIADSYKEGFGDGYHQAEKDLLANKHEKSWRLDEKLWKGIKDIEEASYQYMYDASNDWAYDIPTWEDVQDAFKAGSEWKENLALTWRDMELIYHLSDEIPYMEHDDFFKELLKRYNEKKKELV